MSQRQFSHFRTGVVFRLTLVALLSSAPASAQVPNPIQFEQYALPNGLKVILSPDHTS